MTGDMPKGRAAAKAFLRSAGDFFWPPRSLISGARGMGRGPLSPEDFARLRFISDSLCDRCGVPLDCRTGDETWCVVCLARPPRWDRARAALIDDAEVPVPLHYTRLVVRGGQPVRLARAGD
jgi:hypothetical protein